MAADVDALKRKRGRPASAGQPSVTERLTAAADQLLRQHSHFDLTERQIADSAGVNEAMIRYYYGGKDGLLFDLVRERSDEILKRLQSFDPAQLEDGRVTRGIFTFLASLYYEKPWIVRIMALELPRQESSIRAAFIERYGPSGPGLKSLRQLLQRLIAMGVYRSDIDVENTALGMFSLISGPVMLASLLNQQGGLDQLRSDAWLDYVTRLFEPALTGKVPG